MKVKVKIIDDKPFAYAGEYDVKDIRDMRTVVHRDLSGFKTESKQPDVIYPLYRGEMVREGK